MNLKRKLLLATLPLALGLSSFAQAEMTLKIAEIHPAGYPTVVAMEHLGQKLEEATNGEIKSRMFSGGVLGSEKEVIEQTQIGAVQLTRVSLGSVGPVVPTTNVFNMPFVFRDIDHMRKVVDGEIGQEILDAITDSDFNMVGLAWMEAGSRSLYTKKPVRKIEDLKGLKIRVIGNPLFIDTLNAMGANGIAMDTGEIFSALQSGVIDGAENNSPTLLEHNHFRVAKYYTQTHHLILPEPLLMSKTTWNKLTAEQQALVKKLAKEAQQEERELWTAKEKASDEKLKAAGVEYIEVDTKPFYDATAPVREKYGAQFADLIKRIEAVK